MRLLRVHALALLTLVTFAGCTGDPTTDGPTTSSSTPPATPSSTSPHATTATTSPSSTSTSSSSPPPAPVEFHVGSNYFNPTSATIANGTLTRWILDQGSHTVTVRDAAAQQVHNSEPLPASGTEYRFERTGDYTVICKYHGSMSANIQVQ